MQDFLPWRFSGSTGRHLLTVTGRQAANMANQAASFMDPDEMAAAVRLDGLSVLVLG